MEVLGMLREAQRQYNASGISFTTETLDDYGLGGIDCPDCNNEGWIRFQHEDGTTWSRECPCMKKRNALRRIRKSGLADLMTRYTFDAYQAEDKERKHIKDKAEAFCEARDGWLYISGRSGSGKSHICTAICGRLIENGFDVYYMPWRDESTKLKAAVNTEDYEPQIRKLKTVDVLYIDDFLKGSDTDADIRLAFEILNARYIDGRLRTVISSERDLKELLSRDEALGGRIYERSRGNVLAAPNENWRLTGGRTA